MRAVVLEQDKRKVVKTLAEARLLAHQWTSERTEELKVLPTRIKPHRMAGAEALDLICESLGLDGVQAGIFTTANFKKPSALEWEKAIPAYEADRRKVGISESQISNVLKAAKRFAAHVDRLEVGAPTKAEVEGFLGTLDADVGASAFNGLLGDIGTFLGWLVTKGYLQQNPAQGIERRKIKRSLTAI